MRLEAWRFMSRVDNSVREGTSGCAGLCDALDGGPSAAVGEAVGPAAAGVGIAPLALSPFVLGGGNSTLRRFRPCATPPGRESDSSMDVSLLRKGVGGPEAEGRRLTASLIIIRAL